MSAQTVKADEFQVGLTAAYLTHNDNSFSGGLYRIRPGLYKAFERVTTYQPFQPYFSYEFYFRYSGPIGANHSFGITIGKDRDSISIYYHIKSKLRI
ncbi:MAG: hypothetical protein H3C43_09190 [Leptonema sp. (in: Bacteria)]|nr:hypothetical protein [Leptonema sp. (in: bacteria)]